MSWLIDTDVTSELRKAHRADPGVADWSRRAVGDPVYTSAVVIGELRRGIELRRRKDVVAAIALEQWLLRLVDSYADRIIPVDRAVAEQWGRLDVPDRLPTADALIAATALVHDLTLVTRDVRDMARTGVRILDPFAA